MRTPWGFDCPFFYGDYFRGRKLEECRLIGKTVDSPLWDVKLCKHCLVPGIIRANSCPYMTLEARVQTLFLGLIRRVRVKAYCSLSRSIVSEPHIGCGQCHSIDYQVGEEPNDPDRSS